MNCMYLVLVHSDVEHCSSERYIFDVDGFDTR
jgi:hypothetical protein